MSRYVRGGQFSAAEDIVRKADAAMYLAKQRGSNRVAVFGQSESEGAAA